MKRGWIFGVLAFALAACTTAGQLPAPANLFGGPKTAWDGHPQGRAWTQFARQAVEGVPALMSAAPKDMDAFCPNYAQSDAEAKRDFWVVLIAEIASIESGLNPAAVQGGANGSVRGLTHISVDAAQRYGCAGAGALQLLDPQTNIACAARILAATSGKDGAVTGWGGDGWRGAARYWEDLRKPIVLAQVQERLNAQGFCPAKRKAGA